MKDSIMMWSIFVIIFCSFYLLFLYFRDNLPKKIQTTTTNTKSIIEYDKHGLFENIKLWNKNQNIVPFMIIIDEDLSNKSIIKACNTAIEFWNKNLGFEILKRINEIGHGETIPLMPMNSLCNLKQENNSLGYTRLMLRDGFIWSASIYLNKTKFDKLSNIQLWRVIAHEIGHVIGLEHDSVKNSIMYPSVINSIPVVTGYDSELLIKAYGKKQRFIKRSKND